jgi:para-aminobenzoate synthetase/4-amino-4-deoxychorismate lyase
MESSAGFFGFDFSLEDVKHRLQTVTSKEPCRVKLSLWNDGRLQLETFNLEPVPPAPEAVVSTTRVDSNNLFQRHKTSLRHLYDDQYKKARALGFYEVIYLNEKEEVVEASRHNIFIRKDGQWFTPPVSAGALPGIERAQVIRDKKAVERPLTLADLKSAQDIVLTNSVRGGVSVRLRDSL